MSSASSTNTTAAGGARRPAQVAGLAWVGCVLLTLVLTGCPRFSGYYLAYLAVSLSIAVSGFLFLRALYRLGRTSLAPGFRKLTGYSIIALYVAHSLPRVGWEDAAVITDGRAAFLYALTLLCTAAGIAFLILVTREPWFPRRDKTARKTQRRGLGLWLLEWVDALASAVVVVVLIQTFLFQLYQVPSESMVPVFLNGDRPFTVKLLEGPRLPLTEWRLPFLRQPARGDVVTIANPRYPENSGVNLRKYFSQMVYMATLTLVNIDKFAADGTPKADPLVKRVVGLPGEKLMMVDDVLYARTAERPDYRPIDEDGARFARIDLWKLPAATRARVQAMPVTEQVRTLLEKWDRAKNDGDPGALGAKLLGDWTRLSSHLAGMPLSMLSSFEQRQLPLVSRAIASLREDAMRFSPGGGSNPISRSGAETEDVSLALAIARSSSALAALKEYATAGAAGTAGPTAYERGSRNLNLLIKGNLLQRIDRDIVLMSGGASAAAIQADAVRAGLVQEAGELAFYLERYYDMRNFPEFPAGAAFLGPEQYFAMGDNRYNSLDFRYSETWRPRALDPADPTSVLYTSTLEPFPLEKRFIEGWAVFRVWPPSRLGAIR